MHFPALGFIYYTGLDAGWAVSFCSNACWSYKETKNDTDTDTDTELDTAQHIPPNPMNLPLLELRVLYIIQD